MQRRLGRTAITEPISVSAVPVRGGGWEPWIERSRTRDVRQGLKKCGVVLGCLEVPGTPGVWGE